MLQHHGEPCSRQPRTNVPPTSYNGFCTWWTLSGFHHAGSFASQTASVVYGGLARPSTRDTLSSRCVRQPVMQKTYIHNLHFVRQGFKLPYKRKKMSYLLIFFFPSFVRPLFFQFLCAPGLPSFDYTPVDSFISIRTLTKVQKTDVPLPS